MEVQGPCDFLPPGVGVLPASTVSADLIEQLRVLEEMKSAICGLQARVAVAFDLAHAQRAEQAEANVPASKRGQGVGAQVALARRESPNRGSLLLGLAKALVMEMPRTLAALQSGQLNEWRATLLVKETACLSVEDRCAVDEELAPDTGTFAGKGDRAIIAAAKAAAYRRDPRSVVGRASRAAAERTVSLRPAPDTMTYLTALLIRPAATVNWLVGMPYLPGSSRHVASSWPILWLSASLVPRAESPGSIWTSS
ncbi:HNH endonuclease [Paenarthrobacter nicotinovorans]|nr:HNH endonuclease [Paenarthrobacter nicotinovorans]